MPQNVETAQLRMSRVLPASPEEVFDAYTGAEKQKIWFSILNERPGIVEIVVMGPLSAKPPVPTLWDYHRMRPHFVGAFGETYSTIRNRM